MVKFSFHPSLWISFLRTQAPKEWNVETMRFLSGRPVSSLALSAISLAALLVKVRARMDSWGTPWERSLAILYVMTRVLPIRRRR